MQVGLDVGLEFSKICPKFGNWVSSFLQVIQVIKRPIKECISKPAITQTTGAKSSKLGLQLVIALKKTCTKFGVLTYLALQKKGYKSK